MSWSDTVLGKVMAWLAAALVPLQSLPAAACACPRSSEAGPGFRSLQDSRRLAAGPQGPVQAATCPDCKPRPVPTPSCCQAKAGCCSADRGKCGCCGLGASCACGAVCSCGQSHRHDPQLPPASHSAKAKDLADPAVAATALAGGHHLHPTTSCHPERVSFLVLTPPERLSTLCRFLI